MNRGFAYRERLGPAAAGRTVLDWLSERYAHSDRATWMARIAGGEVTLDGEAATAAGRDPAGIEMGMQFWTAVGSDRAVARVGVSERMEAMYQVPGIVDVDTDLSWAVDDSQNDSTRLDLFFPISPR